MVCRQAGSVALYPTSMVPVLPPDEALALVEAAPRAVLGLTMPLCSACMLLPASLAEVRRARPDVTVAIAELASPADWEARERLLWPRGIHVSRASVPAMALLVDGAVIARRQGDARARAGDLTAPPDRRRRRTVRHRASVSPLDEGGWTALTWSAAPESRRPGRSHPRRRTGRHAAPSSHPSLTGVRGVHLSDATRALVRPGSRVAAARERGLSPLRGASTPQGRRDRSRPRGPTSRGGSAAARGGRPGGRRCVPRAARSRRRG